MTTPRHQIKFTYRDYINAPEDKRYELLNGELVVVPSPRTGHQTISRNLEMILWTFIKQAELGELFHAPLDVVLSDTDVVQPDILFISKDREQIITEDNIRGAPDLVVEILSPSTAERDRTYKLALYSLHGVREYWLVDPDARTVVVMELTEEGFRTTASYGETETAISPLLEGLTVDLSEVF